MIRQSLGLVKAKQKSVSVEAELSEGKDSGNQGSTDGKYPKVTSYEEISDEFNYFDVEASTKDNTDISSREDLN